MDPLIMLFLAMLVTNGSGEHTSYRGYQVIKVTPSNPDQVKALQNLHAKGEFDFWDGIREKEGTEIMIEPKQMGGFMKEMSHQNMSTLIVVKDVERMLCHERLKAMRLKKKMDTKVAAHWEQYHSYDELQDFLKQLAKEDPKIASVQVIGKSTENRTMLVLKVSTGGSGKKAVWVDGNIHAREWITPPMVTYIANELVRNSEKHNDLLSLYDFYLLTNVNPDGYEFTRTTTRLHRKTRSQHACTTVEIGVDANRNWDHNWGGPGSITDPCNNEYNGPSVFSEPENAAIRDFIINTKVDWTYFITFHSSGQLFLLPFADRKRPDDHNEMEAKGNIFNNAVIAAGGPSFFVGNWVAGLYLSAGVSQDWAKSVAKIKYSVTIELTRGHGFTLPPELIKATVVPVWAGLKAMWLS